MLRTTRIADMLRRSPTRSRRPTCWSTWPTQAGGDDNITVVIIDALETPAGRAGSPRRRPSVTGSTGAVAHVDGRRRADGEPAPAAPAYAPRPRRGRASASAAGQACWCGRLPSCSVLGAAVWRVGWYARRTYYVGLAGDRVALYRGVPGGMLGWDPTLEERSAT